MEHNLKYLHHSHVFNSSFISSTSNRHCKQINIYLHTKLQTPSSKDSLTAAKTKEKYKLHEAAMLLYIEKN
jgi:hypothetical protein